MPIKAERLEALQRFCDERLVLTDEPERAERKWLQIHPRPERVDCLSLDAPALAECRQPIKVCGHRAEIEPVRRSDSRLPQQRLDRPEIAAMERKQDARRVEDGPISAHRQGLGMRLEPPSLVVISEIHVCQCAHVERAGTQDTRGCNTLCDPLFDQLLELQRRLPVPEHLLEQKEQGGAVQAVMRRERAGRLVVQSCVPSGLVQFAAGDCGTDVGRIAVNRGIGIVQFVDERLSAPAPLERLGVVTLDECDQMAHVVAA